MNGIDCVAYYNSANYASPTWAAIDTIKDLTVNNKKKEADASIRASSIEMMEPVMTQIEVSGQIRVSLTDVPFIALDDAFINDTLLDMLILNATSSTNGARGWRLDMKLFDWSEDQKIDGVLYRSLTLKPCLNTNVPKRAVVSSGNAVFTSI